MIEIYADCSFRHRGGRCTYAMFDTLTKVFYVQRDHHKIVTTDSATGELKATLAALSHAEKLFNDGVEKDFIIYNDDITNIRILQENNMGLLTNRHEQFQNISVWIMTRVNDLKKRGATVKFKFANRRSNLTMRYVDNIAFDHSKGRLRKAHVILEEFDYNDIVIL